MSNNTQSGFAHSERATNLESFEALLAPMGTPEGRQRGLDFALRPSDIVVTPFGKSGTTWLQQITHTLRTRGDMDFDDISRVCPWIEIPTDLGLDLNAEQKANPRIFKSHYDAGLIPMGGRYIVACRNPQDAAFSMYKFFEGWILEPGAVSADDFVRGTFIESGNGQDGGRGDYWTHLASWWARRNDPDVLFMAFEHMKEDLTGTIRKVASFMEIELDDSLLSITEEHASLPFMQKNKDRFDDRMIRERSVKVSGLPIDSDSAKVRNGRVGESREHLGAAVVAELDGVWREKITAHLGFEDYEAMIAGLR
jgi:hypothetical protein